MPKDTPLKPDDFPVEAEDDKLKTSKGEPIATVKSKEKAHDVADRLNADPRFPHLFLKDALAHTRSAASAH